MEYSNELCHHGIRGMRWGIRRFQRKDGSLTNAGKKRRAKLESELEQLNGKKGSDGDGATKPKSVSEMSNKELQEHTTRMQLERNYYDAQRSLSSAKPQQVSKGKRMIEKFMNDSVMPAVSSAAKSGIEKFMKDKLGLTDKDELAALRKQYDLLDYQQRIDKIKNPDKYTSWDDKTKKYDLERKRMKDEAADAAKAAEDAEKARTEAAAARAARVRTQQDVQSRIRSESAVNNFVNRVTTQSKSRPAFDNILRDEITPSDQVYIDAGKSYVDRLDDD